MPKTKSPAKVCPCGSDKQYKRCCGRRSQSKSDKRRTDKQVYALYTDACLASKERRLMHCLSALKEILKREPFHYGALKLLFATPENRKLFDNKEITVIANNIIRGFHDDIELRCSAADVFFNLGNSEKASKIFSQILEKDPHHFEANFGLGQVSQHRRQLDNAEYHFRQALYARRFAPSVLGELANLLSTMGRKEEAEHYFRITLALTPNDINTLINWSKMEESRSNMDKAWQLYRYVLEHTPEPGINRLKVLEALLHRRDKSYKKALMVLDSIEIESLGPQFMADYWFERTSVLDKMKLYDAAFKSADNANTHVRKNLNVKYHSQKHQDNAKVLKTAFSKKNLKHLINGIPRHENEEQPIFICGFTRSGTSMVEQILSAHSKICGGDELPYIYDLAANAQQLTDSEHAYPQCLFEQPVDETQPSAAQILRQHYLNRFRLTGVLEPGVRRFTDKMPMNEMHLGLIHSMFPESRVVHVFRHPLDSVLSSYFTYASHGDFCTFKLINAAKHYRLLFDLSNHYTRTLKIPYHRVRYEDIVANIEKESKQMLEFLGLGFEQACVDFHSNPRNTRTASYAQVNQPLYSTSTWRYRNYEKHLEPVFEILQPIINELGYSMPEK